MKQYAFLLNQTWHRFTIYNTLCVYTSFRRFTNTWHLTRLQVADKIRHLRKLGAEQRMPEDFDIVYAQRNFDLI